MAGASETLHEERDALAEETIDRHRALVSIQEEFEAIDWYQQRIDATGDAELAAILAHNRDDEKEHMAMVLEWLRRRDPGLDGELRRYLWNPDALAAQLAAERGDGDGEPAPESTPDPSLGIGSLKGLRQG